MIKISFPKLWLTTASALIFTALAGGAGTYAQSSKDTLEDLLASPPPSARYNSVNGTIRLFDSVLIYPLPDWSPKERAANPLASTRYGRHQNEDLFRLEMVPKEETWKDWENLYALMALRNYPGSNLTHARQIASNFRVGCKPSNLNVRPLRGTASKALLIVACGSFSQRPAQGGLAAFVLMQRGTTAVRLYREWRGPAYRSEDPGQWPVSAQTLARVVRSMSKSRLTDAR